MKKFAKSVIRSVLRKAVFLLIRLTLIPLLIREVIQRNKITIILYHDINSKIADKHFKILKSRYNIISLKDFVESIKYGWVDKLPPKSLIITLDDGHKNNYHLKYILEKYDIPTTIFLCSGIVNTNRHYWFMHDKDIINPQHLKKLPDEERLGILKKFMFDERKEYDERQALSKNEIEEMRNMVDFQSHTVFHPILPRCSNERAEREILQSKIDLESYFGYKIFALSYPNGDYSDRDIFITQRAGYECALTLDSGFNSGHSDLFRLKRFCIKDDADINELLVKTSGFWNYLKNIYQRNVSITYM